MSDAPKKKPKARFTSTNQRPLASVHEKFGESKRPQGPTATPDEVTRALKLVSDIAEMIENDVPESKYLKNEEYFENVGDKSKAIGETISKSQRVTEGQLTALENMLEGVRKWTT